MNEADLMIRALEESPDDLTLMGGLVDYLHEHRDMTFSEACEKAEAVAQAARDARDLAAAAELLKSHQPWYKELSRHILSACGLGQLEQASVVLIAGNSPPLHATQTHTHSAGWWTEHTVTVGALWVIAHYRNNPSLCLMAKPKKSRYKTSKRKPR